MGSRGWVAWYSPRARMWRHVFQSRFPKSTGRTCVGEGGFMNYWRRSLKDYRDEPTTDLHGTTATWTEGGDEFIVPYNPWMLLWSKTHVNVEIAATVNVIAYLYK